MSENKVMGRPKRFSCDMRIKKLVKKNPRRIGSKAYESFDIIQNNMLIADYEFYEGRLRDLRYACDNGWVEVQEYQKVGKGFKWVKVD